MRSSSRLSVSYTGKQIRTGIPWDYEQPSHVEALLVDNKGFTKTYALPFPPNDRYKIPIIPRLSTVNLGTDLIPSPVEMQTIEFERSRSVYDDSGKLKYIEFKERPK